ncbi:hypothetical protein GH722_07825 [Alphaproteobacteria bacterium HT1-32]|nr:hypothetical protein [Alphaproteobacteria bacterium HT1-32]
MQFDHPDNRLNVPRTPDRKNSPAEIHFTSLIVSALPEAADDIAATIVQDKRADIEPDPHNGKLIVTLETDSLSEVTEFVDHVSRLPGVINAAMVYHHAEPVASLDLPFEDTSAPEDNQTGTAP